MSSSVLDGLRPSRNPPTVTLTLATAFTRTEAPPFPAIAEPPLLLLGTGWDGPTEEVVGDDAQRTVCLRVLPAGSDDDGRLLLKVEEEMEEGRMRRRFALVWWWLWWRLQDGLRRGSDDMDGFIASSGNG
jgi:hypothetical protein